MAPEGAQEGPAPGTALDLAVAEEIGGGEQAVTEELEAAVAEGKRKNGG